MIVVFPGHTHLLFADAIVGHDHCPHCLAEIASHNFTGNLKGEYAKKIHSFIMDFLVFIPTYEDILGYITSKPLLGTALAYFVKSDLRCTSRVYFDNVIITS